jgi:uncharacterized damage-inducible protein DinB
MQKFFEEYLNTLQACHDSILKVLDGLPQVALDWVPGTDMNSISVLIFHLTGAERYWIGDVAAQEPSNRDRDAEFKVRDVGMDVLELRLTKTFAYALVVLNKLTLEDLEQTRISPRDGQTFTVGWALIHALEHSTLHLGHIQITRQLWEQAS